MHKHNDEVEKYLSEYHPRALRPLQLPQPLLITWSKRLAIAAVVLLFAGTVLWYGLRGKTSSTLTPVKGVEIETVAQIRQPTSFSLIRLALQDDDKFQAELAAESRRVLPNFEGERSTLHVFAKE